MIKYPDFVNRLLNERLKMQRFIRDTNEANRGYLQSNYGQHFFMMEQLIDDEMATVSIGETLDVLSIPFHKWHISNTGN